MALPASGQIAMSDLRTEMSQSATSNYSLVGASVGARDSAYFGNIYTPINVHSSNNGDYPTGSQFPLSDFYSYDNTLNYASDGTNRDLFLSTAAYSFCYNASMILFDLGTTNKTWDITVSGSTNDFQGIDYVELHYGKPWASNGSTTGSHAPIDRVFVNQTGYNNTWNYSYTYDSNRGQYLYVLVISGCY